MMFKIGDKVRTLQGGEIGKEVLIKEVGINFYKDTIIYISEYGNNYYEEELELVQTSEQIAVEKFKEELKANVKDTINIIENSINPTNSEFKRMLRLSRLEAYEEVLKLLE